MKLLRIPIPIIVALASWSGVAHAQNNVRICAQDIFNQNCAPILPPNGISTATENGHVFKTTQGTLVRFQVNNWLTTAGLTVMLLDGAAVPSNGTLATCTSVPSQTNPCIVEWYGIAAAPAAGQPTTVVVSLAPGPFLRFFNGITLLCSSTGPTTLTLSANCTFSGEFQ